MEESTQSLFQAFVRYSVQIEFFIWFCNERWKIVFHFKENTKQNRKYDKSDSGSSNSTPHHTLSSHHCARAWIRDTSLCKFFRCHDVLKCVHLCEILVCRTDGFWRFGSSYFVQLDRMLNRNIIYYGENSLYRSNDEYNNGRADNYGNLTMCTSNLEIVYTRYHARTLSHILLLRLCHRIRFFIDFYFPIHFKRYQNRTWCRNSRYKRRSAGCYFISFRFSRQRYR